MNLKYTGVGDDTQLWVFALALNFAADIALLCYILL